MTEKSDEQVLAQAMGKCWHEAFWFESAGAWECKHCERRFYYEDAFANPTFTTSAELWDLLKYMVGREDWDDFDGWVYVEWIVGKPEKRTSLIKWLLTATYVDKGKEKLLFVKLCAEWCRDKEVKA